MKKGSINGRVLGQRDEEHAQVLFTQSSRPIGELLHFCCTRSSRFGVVSQVLSVMLGISDFNHDYDIFSLLLNLYEDEKISDLTSRIKTMSKLWTISYCKCSPYLLKQ